MTTRTAELDARIASLQAELVHARKIKTDATRVLAADPTNPDSLRPLRSAAQREIEIQEEIDLLESAKVQTLADDASERVNETKREAAQAFEKTTALLAKRAAAAKRLDKVFAELKDAVQAWTANAAEVSSACMDVHKISSRTTPSVPGMNRPTLRDRTAALGNPTDSIVSDMASQMDWATRGLNLHNYVAFQYIRRNTFGPDLVLSEVVKHNDRITAEMKRALDLAGVDVTSTTSQPACSIVS